MWKDGIGKCSRGRGNGGTVPRRGEGESWGMRDDDRIAQSGRK